MTDYYSDTSSESSEGSSFEKEYNNIFHEMKNIFDEQIELYKDKFEQILNKIYKKPHSHLYINNGSQRFFDNWDEIISEI